MALARLDPSMTTVRYFTEDIVPPGFRAVDETQPEVSNCFQP